MIGIVIGGIIAGVAVGAVSYKKAQEAEKRIKELEIENKRKGKEIKRVRRKAKRVKVPVRVEVPVEKVVVKTVKSPKEKFFDQYRALDVELARIVRSNSGGIGLFIKGAERTNWQNGDYHLSVENLKKVRAYRNEISHSKNKWASIKDPTADMFRTLDILRVYCRSHLNIVYSILAKGMSKQKSNVKPNKQQNNNAHRYNPAHSSAYAICKEALRQAGYYRNNA